MIEGAELVPARAEMPRRSRILAAGFAAVAALLLAALVLIVGQGSQARDRALARKQHSYDVVVSTAALEGALARAEAALGRYVIAKDPRSATTYYDEWRVAGRQIDALAGLVRDNRAQAARVAELLRLYRLRGQELDQVTTLILYKRQWNALSLFARAGRSPVLPALSRRLREIVAAERALLDERSTTAADIVSRSDRFVQLLSLTGVLLVLSAVAAGWLAMTSLHAGRAARAQAEAELDRAAALERAVAERTVALSDANQRLREEVRERAEAEARLAQVQKLDAVGQLTGGIAHDFNNMLAVTIGGLELARKRVAEQAAEAARHIDHAMDGATRAAALTRRLLAFARAEPLLPSATDTAMLLVGMSDLIDRTIGERIAVRLSLAPGLWPIWVDPVQLENAILNLCVNARDAMDGAGALELAAANASLRADEVGTLPAGDYVRIAVVDEGTGMAPETLERVFEPFFTTKPVGQGTGLGLSQIFGFVRQSGGEVRIRSALGQGTEVALYLPRHRGAAAVPKPPAAEPVAGGRSGASVLVVEDDPRVRQSTGEALAEIGYRPLLAATEAAALALLASEPVDLLLTDVMMPDVTGPELAARIRALRPDLPVLFVTGYVGDAGEGDAFAGEAVLRKPFTLAALSRAVAQAVRA